MHKIRMSHLSRLTALGLAISLFGVTLAPLAHAQQPAEPKPKPAEPAPTAPAPAGKPAPAAPSDARPTSAKPADVAKPKPPDKKTRDSARKAYGQGEKSFAAGDYVAAHTGFEMANALIPSPQAEYWIAKSLEAQPDKLQEAIAAYERFLANPDAAKAGEDKVADAKTRLEELKAKLVGQVEIATVPAGASVMIDGKPEPGTTPLIVKLPPGIHKLSFTLPEHEAKEVEIDVKAGERAQQKIELVPVAPPPAPEPLPAPLPEPATPPPPPPPPEKRSMVPAFVTLGIAAAGAAVGTVFGLQALSAKNDFKDDPTTDAADDTERNALIADMAFGVAITLGVTGIVLLTSSDDVPAEPTTGHRTTKVPVKLELDTYAGRTGGGGKLRLTF